MAKKPVPADLIKSEAIRQYLLAHRDATIGEIVAGLKSHARRFRQTANLVHDGR